MTPQPQSFDQWNGYYYEYGDGQRCVVTFNVAACDPRNQGSSAGRRLIGFSLPQHVSPQGMPSGPAFERLQAIEARALALLGQHRVPCWLVGRQVYGGMRELVFQIEPPHLQGFDAVCAQIEREMGGTEVRSYEGWKFFNEKIAPDEDARSHISNRDLLGALKQHGADLSKPAALDHTFVGASAGLDAVRRELVEMGFRETGRSERHLTMSATSALEQDEVDTVTRRLRRLASHFGVHYDGWGAALPQ